MLQVVANARAIVRGLSLEARGLIVLIALGSAATACGEPSATAQGHAGRPVTGDSPTPDILATIGDEQITFADVRALAGTDLDRIDLEHRRARSETIENALQAILRERVLEAEARERNQTVAELITVEAGLRLEPTSADVAAWYESNTDRVGGRPLEMVARQIADHLRNERLEAATRSLEERLSRDRNVVVHFDPFRFELANDGAPFLGGRDARVTLAVFSDFQCPFCARFAATMHQLQDEFGDDLNIVYRQFPLTSIHPNAFKAAEASLCAHEQGHFWEMHDAMFAQQGRLAVTELKQLAGQLGLDARRFVTCVDTGRYTEQVQQDLAEGRTIGVTGTPALVLNGIPMPPGALPYDVVANAVRQELARQAR